MIVSSVKTERITAGSIDLLELLDEHITNLAENSVVVITSKVVSLCQNRVKPVAGTDKEELIKQESDLYLPSSLSQYDYHFTITNQTLISLAGIDESNGQDHYVLWPANPKGTANQIRAHLAQKFGLKAVGVIISDSTCMPMRQGTIGIPLAYSGFLAVNDYIGTPDLFGRPFQVSRAGVALGLTAAAVAVMGEGTEQTPIAVITDAPFVQFQDRDPTEGEMAQFYINFEDDLFAPFLKNAPWQKGARSET
ncbi:MAG TPA: coenzyme F420-0:L-glutamate ligase [Candidatus Saccharimonadales bacterium]|nr:coenzyme F420-0:L-glutamate ligase [Candidatus Saccharimonadales bacterium]